MFHVTRGENVELEDGVGGSSVSIVPRRGAIVSRFRVGERDLLYMDASTLEDPAKNVRGGIPILFPSPGKLEGDDWSRGGERGSMKQHGFARDLPWDVTRVATDDVASATMTLSSNDRTRSMYPWDFVIAVKYSLRGATLRLDVSVKNTGAGAMPFGFGIHPYFLVTDKARARISTRATRAFDNVTKSVGPFRGFDLTAREVDLHLLDHGGTESTLTLADGATLAIRGSSELTRWVVWTVAGKDFVCVEPWTCSGNALNTGESILTLPPGAAHAMSIELAYRGPG